MIYFIYDFQFWSFERTPIELKILLISSLDSEFSLCISAIILSDSYFISFSIGKEFSINLIRLL